MLFSLMLTSKGIAGVPRASLVVVAATCGMFDIPIEGIALILPIDHFVICPQRHKCSRCFSYISCWQWEGDDEKM
jgi:hypothetical protein